MKAWIPCCFLILSFTCSLYCKTSSQAGRLPPKAAPDNSLNSTDWAGIYNGILPCADCGGIETTISLNRDLTYKLKRKYLGKPDLVIESSGSFSWNKPDNTVILDESGSNYGQERYQVGENKLTKLDINGNRITGDLAGHYILGKLDTSILEKYWKLTELNGKPVPAGETFAREPHIIFKSKENRVTGNGSCNNFSGYYELMGNNHIALSKMTTTRIACPDMETESQFLKALLLADNYYIQGDTLILNKARTEPLARFHAVYMK